MNVFVCFYYSSDISCILLRNHRFRSFILLIWEFFTPVLADSFPMESEWQQISSYFQDPSQYSGRSQRCCSLDGLHPSSYFQVLQSLYQSLYLSFGDCTKRTSFNWYPQQIPLFGVFSFFCWLSLIIIIIIIIIYSLRVFHIGFSWRFFTGVWVTRLLKSPGLFSVLWPVSIMLFPLVLPPSSPVSLIILWWLYQKHHFRLV